MMTAASTYFDEAAKLPVEPEMVELAMQLIQRQTGKYDPADLEDRYENRLRAMIDAKVAGMPLEPEERPYERGNVIDLVSALRKSLEASKAAEPKTERASKGPPPKKGPPQPASKATRKRAWSVSANTSKSPRPQRWHWKGDEIFEKLAIVPPGDLDPIPEHGWCRASREARKSKNSFLGRPPSFEIDPFPKEALNDGRIVIGIAVGIASMPQGSTPADLAFSSLVLNLPRCSGAFLSKRKVHMTLTSEPVV
jgi:hypothetical protein